MNRDEEKMVASLKPFGWTCGADFWERYYSDAWVFNLANAVQALSERVDALTGLVDFRYLCTRGHHVVSRTRNDLDTCSAIDPWPGGKPCGAQLQPYRYDWEIDYEQ